MKWFLKTVNYVLVLVLLGAVVGAIAVGAAYFYLEPELPDIDNLREVRLQVPLKVLSHDGGLIAEFGEQRRIPLEYAQFPQRMIDAFLSASGASRWSMRSSLNA